LALALALEVARLITIKLSQTMTNEMRVFLMTAQGKEVMEDQQKRKVLLNDPKAIYQDHFVSVRPDCLIVKKFFLPSELPYEYSWRHILTMSYIPQNKDNRESVCGKGMDEEGRWWAVDLLREASEVLRSLDAFKFRLRRFETLSLLSKSEEMLLK
uniref:Uncharacterized protein n=3 Tax=Caenorhabditis japonica TaxID=281687 RepID=A0A8R1DSQ7_CAEJA